MLGIYRLIVRPPPILSICHSILMAAFRPESFRPKSTKDLDEAAPDITNVDFSYVFSNLSLARARGLCGWRRGGAQQHNP